MVTDTDPNALLNKHTVFNLINAHRTLLFYDKQ